MIPEQQWSQPKNWEHNILQDAHSITKIVSIIKKTVVLFSVKMQSEQSLQMLREKQCQLKAQNSQKLAKS